MTLGKLIFCSRKPRMEY